MTEQTAEHVSLMLIQLLKGHGFTCIGSFALPEFNSDLEFNEYKEDYKYSDTDTGFNDLVHRTQIKGEHTAGLYTLASTTLEFFEKAVALPGKFKVAVSELDNSSKISSLAVSTINGESVNIDEALNNTDSRQLIRLLHTIINNLENSDDQFFAALDQINLQ